MSSVSRPDKNARAAKGRRQSQVSLKRTRNTIERWFNVLDAKDAKKLKQLAIFKVVESTPGVRQLGYWNKYLLMRKYNRNSDL